MKNEPNKKGKKKGKTVTKSSRKTVVKKSTPRKGTGSKKTKPNSKGKKLVSSNTTGQGNKGVKKPTTKPVKNAGVNRSIKGPSSRRTNDSLKASKSKGGNKGSGKTNTKRKKPAPSNKIHIKNESKRIQTKSKKNNAKKAGKKASNNRNVRVSPKLIKSIPLTFRKKTNQSFLKISFPSCTPQELVLAINNHPFKEVKYYIRGYSNFFPRALVAIFRVKKTKGNTFYISNKTALDYTITKIEHVKQFLVESISEYNNAAALLIETLYSESIHVYKITQIGLRFIYPTETI